MEAIKISLPIPPSVNHCYTNNNSKTGKGRNLTPEGKNWKLYAGYVASRAAKKVGWKYRAKGKKTVIELIVFWPDRRRRDMNNCHKLLCDAFEKILYEDDCNALARDMDYSYDKKDPRLELTIYPLDGLDS